MNSSEKRVWIDHSQKKHTHTYNACVLSNGCIQINSAQYSTPKAVVEMESVFTCHVRSVRHDDKNQNGALYMMITTKCGTPMTSTVPFSMQNRISNESARSYNHTILNAKSNFKWICQIIQSHNQSRRHRPRSVDIRGRVILRFVSRRSVGIFIPFLSITRSVNV